MCEKHSSNCSAKQSEIIKAHSISNSLLETISEGGHVIVFKTNAHDLDKFYWKEGVKNASTFRGFCGCHDNKLFEEIDARTFKET